MSLKSKETLRKEYLDRRNSLSSDEVESKSKGIAERVVALVRENPIAYLHTFLPINKFKEINTWFLIDQLQTEVKIVVPKMSESNPGILDHFVLDRAKLEENHWGIPEPSADSVPVEVELMDAVIVPLLAFDRQGYRVGYGKAFYDRFLSECKGDTLKIGVSYFEAEEEIDHDSWDIALDYCVTPEKTYSFRA